MSNRYLNCVIRSLGILSLMAGLCQLSGCGSPEPYYTLDRPEPGKAIVTIHTKEGKTEKVTISYKTLDRPSEALNPNRTVFVSNVSTTVGKAQIDYVEPLFAITNVTYDGQVLKQRKPM